MSVEKPYVIVKMSCIDYDRVSKLVNQYEKLKEKLKEKSREKSQQRSGKVVTPREPYTTQIKMEVINTGGSSADE